MAKKGATKRSKEEEEKVGELGDNGASTEDAAAHITQHETTATDLAAGQTGKKRTAYYMILSMSKYGTADSVLGTFRSQRAAEKWLIANRVLISKVAEQVVLIRARNVEPRL